MEYLIITRKRLYKLTTRRVKSRKLYIKTFALWFMFGAVAVLVITFGSIVLIQFIYGK